MVRLVVQHWCHKCGKRTPEFSGTDADVVLREVRKHMQQHGWFVGADITLCPTHAKDKTVEFSV